MKQIVVASVLLITSGANYAQETSEPVPLTPKRLTNLKDSYPLLSPDGTKVLFQSNRTGNWEIFVMNADGKNAVQLTTNPAPDASPSWSPDGRQIVFASERDGDSEIYLMNADGGTQRRLTEQPGDDSHPHWSPDGTRIVFNSARSTADLKAPWPEQAHEIFTMKADGSDLKQISNLKTVSTYPSYSPDGKRICFRSVTNEPAFRWDLTSTTRNSEVFVMNADGTNPVNLSKSAAYDGWPMWSPDGKRIVFSSNRSGPAGIGQLYLVNPDGSGLRRITEGPGSFVQPTWSCDGKKILAQQHWETDEFANLAEFSVPPLEG